MGFNEEFREGFNLTTKSIMLLFNIPRRIALLGQLLPSDESGFLWIFFFRFWQKLVCWL
jgi:hypothetical protein